MMDEFPETLPGRPIWLMTLADLALLLVGFFVLVQASQHLDRKTLARGIREGFGGATGPVATPEPIPMAAAAMMNFAPGSAALPSAPAGLIAWAREAVRDPRVTLKISGSADGSAADVDPATGNGAVLAADRARAVAAAFAAAHVAPAGRITIVNAPDLPGHNRRTVIVTMGFAGERQRFAVRQPDPAAARRK